MCQAIRRIDRLLAQVMHWAVKLGVERTASALSCFELGNAAKVRSDHDIDHWIPRFPRLPRLVPRLWILWRYIRVARNGTVATAA